MSNDIVPNGGEILWYQTDDGATRLDVRVENETVWLSLNQMAELFDRDKSVISRHIKNIFDEGELLPDPTVAKYATVQTEGARDVTRQVEFYNLDVIISVGYRVKSLRGTQFRIWATQRLREYIVKGFAIDDRRLKDAGGVGYFDELLERIRDIRSSERLFWRKVLDIYATSIDYDARAEPSKRFFQTVQNKMHWAAHGHTAAEVIHQRADAQKPNMGLMNWSGDQPRKRDALVAKNFLNEDELKALNLIVSAYLDFAELQALNRRAMHMRDWIAKLDDFLRLSEREILSHAGMMSSDEAKEKARLEYDKFRTAQASLPQPVDTHFDEAIKNIKKIEKKRPAKKKSKAGKRRSKKPPTKDAP